ncbi:MAG TPA: cohesin domain-containing protein [Candidatus Saccharimonadales bacterium]|nr:cohesin domain-containing protein [Candidatus Saccharimonadales bacterium]
MKKLTLLFLIILTIGALFVGPKLSGVFAATMLLDPATATVEEGKDLTVSVVVSADNELVDGVDANIAYDSNYLKIKEMKKGSEFKDYPVFKDNNGQVQITALAPTNDGKVLVGNTTIATVTFEILDTGVTKLTIAYKEGATSESNVTAHASAKDLLTSVGGGTYTVNASPDNLRAAQAKKASRSFIPILIFILILILVGVLIWYYRKKRKKEEDYFVPEAFPMDEVPKTEEGQEVQNNGGNPPAEPPNLGA